MYSEVLFNDPSEKDLNARFSNLKQEDFENNKKSPEINLFLGILYFNGFEKYEISKDIDKSIGFYKAAWHDNISDAGYALSKIYHNGIGVSKDSAKAKYYLEESAESGYIRSQKLLAKAYWGQDLQGLYVKNIDKAVYWFKESANQGDSESALILSRLYLNDEEVDKDLDESFKWVEKGLHAKYDTSGIAPYIAAEYYEKGWGVDKNLVLAYKYYDLSGTAGSKGKSRVSKNMSDAEIEEAIKQSRAWQAVQTFLRSFHCDDKFTIKKLHDIKRYSDTFYFRA
ncbi:tetratricopeptide repeat protein [Cobetia sp. SIMBA_158]|uniref:tetratricopeptide repeat protein n=2 Tax=Pseudomonadota TaxID=1224 RepID=UPI00397F9E81